MHAESKSNSGGAPPLSSLYSGLSDFSSLLTSAIGSIDTNVHTLQSSTDTNQQQIETLKKIVDRYGAKLLDLELEAEAQRSKLENALLNVTDMGRSIDSQLSDATKQLHRELLTQRTATKMDLFSLQGTMRKSVNEALDLIQETPKLLKSSATYNPNSSNEEGIKYLLEKIRALEEALAIQHTVNLQLSETAQNNDVIQKVYDSLFEQFTQLENSLLTANTQNQELREKYQRDLGKMRETQSQQQNQISQLVGALLSNKNMKKFKATMSRVAEGAEDGDIGQGSFQPKSHHRRQSRDDKTEKVDASDNIDETGEDIETGASNEAKEEKPKKGKKKVKESKEIAESSEEEEEEEEAAAEPRSRKKSSRKQRRKSESESDEEQSDQEDGFDEHDRNPGPRSKHRMRRHHHHVTRHGKVHRSDTTPASPSNRPAVPVFEPLQESASAKAGREAAAELKSNETESAKARRPTELRKQKTFNSVPAAEKQTQTTAATANTVSTNTEKAATTAVSTSTDKSRPVTPKAEKIVFDDDLSLVENTASSMPVEVHMNSKEDVESLDGSYSYYDSDSYYSTSIVGGVTIEQLEKVAADSKRMVDGVREECSKRTDELEESMHTFKRIAFMLEDMKINYELLKAKVDALSVNPSGPTGSFDDMKTTAQHSAIQHAKNLWTRVHAELLFGLQKFAENESDEEDEGSTKAGKSSKEKKQFSAKAAALVGYLDSNLTAFHPAESIAQTLKIVHPMLDNIYRQAAELDALDDTLRQAGPAADSEICQFDKLICSDATHNMKQYVQEAMAASVAVLDESIPKVAMRQRLEMLEKLLREKVEKKEIKALHDEVRAIAKSKVDIQDFQVATSKLATTAELSKLNLYVADIGGRGSAAGYNNAPGGGGGGSIDIERAELQKNPDFQSLLTRFDMLGKQQLDLHNFCGSFVPREEVHEAMKAVINEVKTLKQNTVNHALFRDGLKSKADITEVERYVFPSIQQCAIYADSKCFLISQCG